MNSFKKDWLPALVGAYLLVDEIVVWHSTQPVVFAIAGFLATMPLVRRAETFYDKVPTKSSIPPDKRSIQLEREAGLVFDQVGDLSLADTETGLVNGYPVFRLWPGYWEWKPAGGGPASSRLQRVKPSGCKDNYWISPEKYSALEALDFFENEMPALLKELEALDQKTKKPDGVVRISGPAPSPAEFSNRENPATCSHVIMNDPSSYGTFCYLCSAYFPGAAQSGPVRQEERLLRAQQCSKSPNGYHHWETMPNEPLAHCRYCGVWTDEILFSIDKLVAED